MNTDNRNHEQISALSDGELTDHELTLALAALRDPEQQLEWEIYHQIGDILRSDDLDIPLSAGFSDRLAARLAQEPSYLLPEEALVQSRPDQPDPVSASGSVSDSASVMKSIPPYRLNKQAAVGVMAAVAMLFVILLPNFIVHGTRDHSVKSDASPSSSDRNSAEWQLEQFKQHHRIISAVRDESSPYIKEPDVERDLSLDSEPVEDMLRDPHMDGYLVAHQRYSSLMYSGVQYATRQITPAVNSTGR